MRSVQKIAGLPIIDAKRSLRLKVTLADISGAKSKKPDRCAAAVACRKHLHVEEARVHLSRVYLKAHKAKTWVRYLTPRALRSEIIAFDRGGRFAPGDYSLGKVPTSMRFGKQTGASGPNQTNTNRDRKNRKRHLPHRVTGVRGGPL